MCEAKLHDHVRCRGGIRKSQDWNVAVFFPPIVRCVICVFTMWKRTATSFPSIEKYFLLFLLFKFCHSFIVPMGFLPWEIWVAFPGESQLRQSCATQPTMHAECFSFTIIHGTLTWTTGSLMCTQMFMHAIAHRVVQTSWLRESALKVDSGRNIPCRTWESNLYRQRAGPLLYQLSYIPTPFDKTNTDCLSGWLCAHHISHTSNFRTIFKTSPKLYCIQLFRLK